MENINNIIFDFGGVIINIDTYRLVQMLVSKGIDNIDQVHAHLVNNEIYNKFETGHVTAQQFRDEIRSQLSVKQTDEEIDHDWNAIILNIPEERVSLLEKIRDNYKIFLLSNTNIIHFDFYNRYFADTFAYNRLADMFEKAYFSHQMGLRKPDPAIYKEVLSDSGILPEETLFIDDNKDNVEAANALGIQGFHLQDGMELVSLFQDGKLAI